MDRPVKKEWLEPFRKHSELEAQEYEASFEPPVPRRTALNRLTRLREAGYVGRRGQGRSTIYCLTEAGSARLAGEGTGKAATPSRQERSRLSDEAEALRARLRRPVSERDPVGYERAFLEAYQPNQTFYLTETARRDLLEIGSQTGMADEPAGTYARHICFRVADMDEAMQALVNHDWPITAGPRPRGDGGTQLYIHDPDGHLIELVYLPWLD